MVVNTEVRGHGVMVNRDVYKKILSGFFKIKVLFLLSDVECSGSLDSVIIKGKS